MFKRQPRILIIEDDKVTVELITYNLLHSGYLPLSAAQGKTAIDQANALCPDLILLDLGLPDVPGIEVCKRLKQLPQFKDTPIIILTAQETTQHKLEAFNAGAVDYITKPLEFNELMARVKTHLELFFANQKLSQYAQNMEKLAEERAKQLHHADRLVMLGTLSAGIAHEINNPTAFISGNIQTLHKFWGYIQKHINPELCKKDCQINFIQQEMPSLINGIKEGVKRIHRIVDSLKTFSRKDKIEFENIDLCECINKALYLCRQPIKQRKVNITTQILSSPVLVKGDMQQLEQVIVNLILNAIDSIKNTPQPEITISLTQEHNCFELDICDNGRGIDADIIAHIWDPFFTTKEPGKGTGLGLSISKSIIDNHSGSIQVVTTQGKGACFCIELPVINEDNMC